MYIAEIPILIKKINERKKAEYKQNLSLAIQGSSFPNMKKRAQDELIQFINNENEEVETKEQYEKNAEKLKKALGNKLLIK